MGCKTVIFVHETLPLWFGNQHVPNDVNPTYGRLLLALAEYSGDPVVAPMASRSIEWLRASQNQTAVGEEVALHHRPSRKRHWRSTPCSAGFAPALFVTPACSAPLAREWHGSTASASQA